MERSCAGIEWEIGYADADTTKRKIKARQEIRLFRMKLGELVVILLQVNCNDARGSSLLLPKVFGKFCFFLCNSQFLLHFNMLFSVVFFFFHSRPWIDEIKESLNG